MDVSQSLAELSGIDWGPAPATASELIRERHDFRRTPLKDLTDAGLVRLLDLGDETLLVPFALERLRERPEAIGVLCAVLAAEGFPWRERPDDVAAVRAAADAALNDIGTITDDLERLAHEAMVYRSLVRFERRLSMFPA